MQRYSAGSAQCLSVQHYTAILSDPATHSATMPLQHAVLQCPCNKQRFSAPTTLGLAPPASCTTPQCPCIAQRFSVLAMRSATVFPQRAALDSLPNVQHYSVLQRAALQRSYNMMLDYSHDAQHFSVLAMCSASALPPCIALRLLPNAQCCGARAACNASAFAQHIAKLILN